MNRKKLKRATLDKVDGGLARQTRDEFKVQERLRYEEMVRIDRNMLDEEVESQAKKFREVCENHVLVMSLRDELKDNFNKTYAEIKAAVAADLEKRGIRATVARIETEAQTSKQYADLKNKIAEANKQVNLWEACRESFRMRSEMLKALGHLWSSNYFTKNSIESPNVTEEELAAYRRRRKTKGIS